IRELAQNKLKFTPLSEEERITFEGVVNLYENTSAEGTQLEKAYLYAAELLQDGGRYSVHNPDFLTGANISVAITREFMEAVENDADYALRFPDIESYSEYDMALYDDTWHEIGDVREWEARGMEVKTHRTIKA